MYVCKGMVEISPPPKATFLCHFGFHFNDDCNHLYVDKTTCDDSCYYHQPTEDGSNCCSETPTQK